MKLKPCPFCGKELDLKDPDVLYQTGIVWKEEEGIRHYFSRRGRYDFLGVCYGVNCPTCSGGCGVQMTGDSDIEAVNKWNTRINQ